MTLGDNPYQPPAIESPSKSGTGQESRLWWYVFWAGVCMGAFGGLNLWVPSVPSLGFFLVALVLLGIAAVFSKKCRRRSVIGVVVLLGLSTLAIRQIRVMHAHEIQKRALMREHDRLQELVRQAESELKQKLEKNAMEK